MKIQPVTEEIKISGFKKIAVSQSVVQARLLPQPGESIAKILSVGAKVKVTSTEVFTGEARYGGNVRFNVLFVSEDGRSNSIEYVADFSDKIENPAISATLSPWVDATVLDTEVVSLRNDEIKLACVLEIKLCAVVTSDVNFISSGGEGVYTHIDKVEYSRFITGGKAVIEQQNRIDKLKLKRVLLVENSVALTSATAERDFIKVSGVIYSHVTGETDEGLLSSYNIETPFDEEIGAKDARSGDNVRAVVDVSAQTREENDQEICLLFDYALEIRYAVFSVQAVTVVTDVFIPSHELIPTFSEENIFLQGNAVSICERVDGSVTIQNDMPLVDNIMATTAFNNVITNVIASENEGIIEGVISGNIIYYSAETDSKNSIEVELPYSIKTEIDGIDESYSLYASGQISGLNLKIRRGNEIDVRAEISLLVQPYKNFKQSFMTALTVGEERKLPTCAFSVHIAREKETLWEVAKALGVTPELIMEQNPNLQLPLSGGERIAVYRCLSKD